MVTLPEIMKAIIRNVLAVIVSLLLGGIANMALIKLSPHVIPPPAGVNVEDLESLKHSMHLFQPKHFIFSFAAHAAGSFVAAFLAALMVTGHRMKFAVGIGAFSLLGGIAACLMIPAPVWFMALDLIVAYIPMGWLGGRLALKIRPSV